MTRAEQLREELAEIVYTKDLHSKPAIPFSKQSIDIRNVYFEWADALLQTFKKAGGVILVEDAKLPENPWQDEYGCGYIEAQEDMHKEGWRKIEGIKGT